MEPITWSWMEIVFAFILWWSERRKCEKSSTEIRPKKKRNKTEKKKKKKNDTEKKNKQPLKKQKKKKNETETPTVGLACLALTE